MIEWVKAVRREHLPAAACGLASVCALLVVYVSWLVGDDRKPVAIAASLVSVLLFAAVVFLMILRFAGESRLSREASFFSLAPAEDKKQAPPADDSAAIFFLLLAFSLVIAFLAGILRLNLVANQGDLASATRRIWSSLDSQHYLYIAEHWYANEGSIDNIVRLVFLPGYPILIRLVSVITGDYFAAGMIVSALCFSGAGVMLYRLVLTDFDRSTARLSVAFLCAIPGSFFFVAPMTESVFLLCTLASLYLLRKGHPVLAGLTGFYAAFTRSAGVFLLVVPFVEIILDTVRRVRAVKGKENVDRTAFAKNIVGSWLTLLPCALLTIGGLCAYFLVNYQVSGEFFRFMTYQSEHWGQHLGYFFNTAGYSAANIFSYVDAGKTEVAVGLWVMGIMAQLVSLVVLLLSAKRVRASYLAYALSYYAFSIGATWLLSAPRYLAALFVLPLSFALLGGGKKRVAIPLLAVCAAVNIAYIVMFVLRWQVW